MSSRSPAQFLHFRGCFWVANSAVDKVPMSINEAPLEPGTIAPLADGQVLELGGRRYAVEVEA
jgi:hypothetical protein